MLSAKIIKEPSEDHAEASESSTRNKCLSDETIEGLRITGMLGIQY